MAYTYEELIRRGMTPDAARNALATFAGQGQGEMSPYADIEQALAQGRITLDQANQMVQQRGLRGRYEPAPAREGGFRLDAAGAWKDWALPVGIAAGAFLGGPALAGALSGPGAAPALSSLPATSTVSVPGGLAGTAAATTATGAIAPAVTTAGKTMGWLDTIKTLQPLISTGVGAAGQYMQSKAAGEANEQQIAESRRQFDENMRLQQQQLALQAAQADPYKAQKSYANMALMEAVMPNLQNFSVSAPSNVDLGRNPDVSSFMPHLSGGVVDLLPGDNVMAGGAPWRQTLASRYGDVQAPAEQLMAMLNAGRAGLNPGMIGPGTNYPAPPDKTMKPLPVGPQVPLPAGTVPPVGGSAPGVPLDAAEEKRRRSRERNAALIAATTGRA